MYISAQIACLLLIILNSLTGCSGPPGHELSGKTVRELVSLLESPDAGVRFTATSFIADRYRNPKAIFHNGPVYKSNSPATEFPIPSSVVPALATHLKSDKEWTVRVGSLFALRSLRFHTDTTPIVALALDDKDAIVRIRACTALIDIAREYSEPLHPGVIPTLMSYLDVKGEEDHIWQAAYNAGQLGTNGVALAMALRTLTSHDSLKVRDYVGRALSLIEPEMKK